MECFACCTASSYSLKSLFENLRSQYKATFYRDIIHIELQGDDHPADLFLFSFGVQISWGLTQKSALEFVKQVKDYENHPLDEFEWDEFSFFYGSGPAKIDDDVISLPSHDPMIKLAISYAIAQSVKLETFEASILKTFNNTKQLPDDLATKGKIFLSRKEIRRKMGQLFIERSSINLHLDVLDTPDIFWERSELEPTYKMAAVYLEINTRVDILNHRLDVLHELLEMLGNELNHQHSSRLEWTIILLIVIEVVLIVAKDIFKWT